MTTQYLTVDHLSLKDIIRIFSHVIINPSVSWNGTPCWTWDKAAGRSRKYGQFAWGGTMERSHRVMYAWLVGPIPKKKHHEASVMEIDHMCLNTLCCNPIHLQLISKAENAIGPRHNKRKTICKRGHPLTPENYIAIQGSRRCKFCVRIRWAEHYYKGQPPKRGLRPRYLDYIVPSS